MNKPESIQKFEVEMKEAASLPCNLQSSNIKPMTNPVRIFKCTCEGNKFILAGEPNSNPTLAEKREYGELIALGCTVLTIDIEEFRKDNWTYCSNKHLPSKH